MRIFHKNFLLPIIQSRDFSIVQINRIGNSITTVFQSQLHQFITTPRSQTLNIVALIGPYFCNTNISFTSNIVHFIGVKELVRSLCNVCQNCAKHNKFSLLFAELDSADDFDWKKTIENTKRHFTDLTSKKIALLRFLPKRIFELYEKEDADELINTYRHFIETKGLFRCHLSGRIFQSLEDVAILDTEPTKIYYKADIIAFIHKKRSLSTFVEPNFLIQPFAKIPTHINFAKNAIDGFSPEKAFSIMGQFYLAFETNRTARIQPLEFDYVLEKLRMKLLKFIVFAMDKVRSVNFIVPYIFCNMMLVMNAIVYTKIISFMVGCKIDLIHLTTRLDFVFLPVFRAIGFAIIHLPRLASTHLTSAIGAVITAQIVQNAWSSFCQVIEKEYKEAIYKYELFHLEQKISDLMSPPSLDGGSQVAAVAWHLHMLLKWSEFESDIDELIKKCTLTCPISHDDLKMDETIAVVDTNLTLPFKGEVIVYYLDCIKRMCPSTNRPPRAILFPFAQPDKVLIYKNATDQINFSQEWKQSRALLRRKFLDDYFMSNSAKQIPKKTIINVNSIY